MKKFFRYMALIACTITLNGTAFAASEVSETVGLSVETECIDIGGKTMIPLRKAYEGLGAEIEWDSSSGAVSILKEDTVIKTKLNSRIMEINGINLVMENPLLLINDSIYITADAVAESLGCNISFGSASVYLFEKNDTESAYDTDNQSEPLGEEGEEKSYTIMYSSMPGTMFVNYPSGTPKVSCRVDTFKISDIKAVNDKYLKINVFLSGDINYNIGANGENYAGDKNIRLYLVCYDEDGKKIASPSVVIKDEGFEINKTLNVPIETERISLELK